VCEARAFWRPGTANTSQAAHSSLTPAEHDGQSALQVWKIRNPPALSTAGDAGRPPARITARR